jgi:hypothetical protein
VAEIASQNVNSRIELNRTKPAPEDRESVRDPCTLYRQIRPKLREGTSVFLCLDFAGIVFLGKKNSRKEILAGFCIRRTNFEGELRRLENMPHLLVLGLQVSGKALQRLHLG